MKRTTQRRIFLAMLVVTVAMSAGIIAFQMFANDAAIDCVSTTNISAKVETWREQTFWDQFWGNGLVQTSTKYTVNPDSAKTNTVYENWRTLLSTSNRTTETQSASYNYSETKGHEVSAEVSGKSSHFEAAVGYKFSYATTTGYSANVNVPAKKSVLVRAADARIKMQYTTYTTQPQKYKSWFDLTWINNGSATVTRPYIKQYGCIHIEWSYK